MKIRQFISATLVLVISFAAVSSSSFAEGLSTVIRDARQMMKLNRVWATLDAAEAQALSEYNRSKAAVVRSVYRSALNNDLVDKDSFSDFTENGFFFSVDGMYCSYNYRLRNELIEGATPVPKSEQFVLVKGKAERLRVPQSPDVLLIGPYYGHDAVFSDQYRIEAQSIANATGGDYTLIQGVAATGPIIARHFTNKGVVIFDSHGTQSGESSYLCLSTNSGITVNDYENGWAVRAGNTAYIDGRYIQNHINGNLANCFVWMAMCEGMKLEGRGTTGAALIAAGAGGVYGYSQAISFRTEYNYEETFWNRMKLGDTVADAMRVMKALHGENDRFGDPPAWPIVMSPTDDFPENPDGPQNVNCDWTLVEAQAAAPINNVTLENVEVELFDMKIATLTVEPEHADYTATWCTDDPSVAVVDENGTVVGLGLGSTTLSVDVHDNTTDTNYNRTATITVIESNVNEGEIILERAASIENGSKYVIVADNSITSSMGYAVGNTATANDRYLKPIAVALSGNRAIVADSDLSAVTWSATGNRLTGFTFRNEVNNKAIGFDESQCISPSKDGIVWNYTEFGALDNRIDSNGYYYLTYSNGKYTTSKTAGAVRLYKVLKGEAAASHHSAFNTVTFIDWDGSILQTQQVEYGNAAQAPSNPTRQGYTFNGWSQAFHNITANTVVRASYIQNKAVATAYELASSVEPGCKYVIVAEKSISGTEGYAIGNAAVSGNHYLSAARVHVNSNGTLALPAATDAASITWHVEGNAYDGYTFRNESNARYLGLDSEQFLAPTSASTAWRYNNGIFENRIDSEGYYFISYAAERYTTAKSRSNIRLYRVVEG